MFTWMVTGCLISISSAQTSLSGMQKKGDESFEKSDYRSAVSYYKQAGVQNNTDKKARLRLAISEYEVNDVDGALAILNSINNEGKTSAEVYFYMAKCLEAKNLFTEAIGAYKHFLQRAKKDDSRQTWVKDQLIRCANGSRLKYGDESAYVENAGTTLNTEFNEFGVKNSPTNIGKIYFSSDREITGIPPPARVEIYSAALDNGRWSAPTLLPHHINTGPYQEVCGFSSNGQILYYLMQQDNQFGIRTDTFTEQANVLRKGYFNGPFDVNRDGTDLTFFNDSICLYASNIAGGYGGYDLYIAFKKNDKWSAGVNLGPVINSFYDDRYPFLTRNGLTLFYSSNNLESIGGFDIFSTSFDPATYQWSKPKNLGFPINTAADETDLVIAPDGTSAYLTSDRKDGYGKRDIYTVYFKQPLIAHEEISDVPTFQHLLLSPANTNTNRNAQEQPVEVKEYYISHLFLEENAEILIPQNTKKLDLLANLMMIYPKITAELSCFEVPAGQQTFSLYFSIKKVEEAAGYLVKKGIARSRILLKGYGPSFPLVTLPEGTTNTSLYKRLNHRIEITLHDYETEPVIIHMEKIPVPDNMVDARGQKFMAMRHGMYYSVQLVTITQILQNPNLESLDEMYIDVDNAQGNYHYMTGMIPTFIEADALKQKMIADGFPDAQVIAYLDGMRIKLSDIPALAPSYPDLLLYQQGTNK
jgi:hypothetical protein